VGCCLVGCVRFLFYQLWKLALAAIVAMLLARVDDYIERDHGRTAAGKAWRTYRRRGKKKPSA
jgi:hypothetical protein